MRRPRIGTMGAQGRANRGVTVIEFASGRGGGFGSIDGLPPLKPPYGRITAIDMNTGEPPLVDPERRHPRSDREPSAPRGHRDPNTGYQGNATVLVTRSLLMFTEGRGGRLLWYAADKQTGERIGAVEIPAPVSTAPMTYLHDGVQYIVLSIAGNGIPGSIAALRLPD